MTILESTNRECDQIRFFGPAVVKADPKERELLDSLAVAMSKFTGSVKVIPFGVSTFQQRTQAEITERTFEMRQTAQEERRQRKEREARKCINGCKAKVRYGKLMICQACYIARLRSKAREQQA